jgi:PAS domain S-box-containing protein
MQGASESPPADETRVVVLPGTAADGIAIGRLLDACRLTCLVVPSVQAVCAAVGKGAGVLVIAEEMLDADGADLIECIGAQPVWSDLPVILLSSSGSPESATLPAVAPQLGNVSVVERPVGMSTLVSLIRSSLRARGRQYQVREHLARQEDAQRAIREAQQRFRLLVDNIKDYAIFMIDPEGRVASWNSGAEHTLGYSSEEILGQPAARFFVPEGPGDDMLAREMQQARVAGRATSTGWRARKNGERLYVEGVLSAVRDDEGRLLGYAKLMKDVTARRRIEAEREQLLQSERAARGEAERTSRVKDEFLATLGHELRTPLNAILGWSQVLRRVGGGNAELAQGLMVIERNARAQAQIIEDLLDMSSIISGKVRLDMRTVDLPSVLEASVNAVKPAAEAKGIELELALDVTTHAVRADPNRLQQVFWNLLTNAVKFTPKGGRVSVTLERVNAQMKVSVADTGEGIDAAFLPYIFERFRQADASASRRHGGLGLGLSIVKQLIELHGGSINASSDGNGAGSTFTVELPALALDVDAAARSASRHQPSRSMAEQSDAYARTADLGGVRVLVVDDEPDARSLIERLLEDCDATVTTAASASEALEHVAREAPDVLLSDIGMPAEDGYSLMRRIRNLTGEASRVPAIALTAYARSEDRDKALQAGYQMHLAKPVEPVKLIEMVTSLVTRRRRYPPNVRDGSPSS